MAFWRPGVMLTAFAAVLNLMACPPLLSAAPDEESPLECLRCHTRALQDHDKLGTGSEACWACHDGRKIGTLHLSDGTPLPLEESNQLCGECHPDRYEAWKKNKHGLTAWSKNRPEILNGKKPKCVGCHSAHQPKINLSKGSLTPINAGVEDAADCLKCHSRALEGHDKLGPGSKACWACHYNMEMGVLHLRLSLRIPVPAGGERLRMSDYPKLCAQCHQTRYEEWVAGTHGIPAWEEGVVNVHGARRVGCIGCHDPHKPRVSFSKITLPHPSPQPPPPPSSYNLLALLGTAFLIAVGAGVALFKKGEWP